MPCLTPGVTLEQFLLGRRALLGGQFAFIGNALDGFVVQASNSVAGFAEWLQKRRQHNISAILSGSSLAVEKRLADLEPALAHFFQSRPVLAENAQPSRGADRNGP